jgi:lysozyme family protein
MDHFTSALALVLKNEGGFIDNVNDPGGATNAGISLRFLRQIPAENLRKYGIFKAGESLSVEDVRDLSDPQILQIYHGEFWVPANLDLLVPLEWDDLCAYVFDMIVLHGIGQGIKLLQRAIWAYYLRRNYNQVVDDGLLGEKTIAELSYVDDHDFLRVLATERAGYCRMIAALNPKEKEFLDAWIDRCFRI